jgi:SAM-dependent methyltransferase
VSGDVTGVSTEGVVVEATSSISAAAGLACLHCGPAAPSRPALDGLLHRCDGCGFGWTVPTGDTVPVGRTAAGDEDHFLERPRRFEAARRLQWLSNLARPRSLLEAGCAAGFFLDAVRGAGVSAVGIDVSEPAARYARERLGVPVRHGLFEKVVPTMAPVEAVCAFRVLERVEDPHAFIDIAYGGLLPGGWLALEVPNFASGAARRLGTRWAGLQPRAHRWHFTPRSLTGLLTRGGFRVLRHDTVVFRHYLPGIHRLRRIHRLLAADLRNTGSLRPTHPRSGDLLRVLARRPYRQERKRWLDGLAPAR